MNDIWPAAFAGTFAFASSAFAVAAASSPPPVAEIAAQPVVYTENEKADKRWHHAGFRAAIGVHKIQVFRANRTLAPEGGAVGWTYNHAPMLAYWEGRFWINYVSNLVEDTVRPEGQVFFPRATGIIGRTPRWAFPWSNCRR